MAVGADRQQTAAEARARAAKSMAYETARKLGLCWRCRRPSGGPTHCGWCKEVSLAQKRVAAAIKAGVTPDPEDVHVASLPKPTEGQVMLPRKRYVRHEKTVGRPEETEVKIVRQATYARSPDYHVGAMCPLHLPPPRRSYVTHKPYHGGEQFVHEVVWNG